MVTAKRARDIHESTLSTAQEDCLRNFPNLKEIRKEQKTCLLNLARDNGFRQKFVFLAVYTSGKSCWNSESMIIDNGFGDVWPSAAAIGKFEDVERIM